METIIFKTLLHSLWQGLALALITALILMFTSRSSAKLRYNLLISGLILFAVSSSLSFVYEWQKSTQTNFETLAVVAPVVHDQQIQGEVALTGAEPVDLLQKAVRYFSGYASTIVLVWFLVICARSVQLFAGLYSIKRIRNTQVSPAGVYWENRVKALALQFGITQMVQIVQSGIVKVPMVVGHLKPLILVPIGLINGLSEKEVEAIICHELAHIKRRDYLVNILQSLMEIVFFFNPAVLWISKLIREERESCCDDMTISSTHDKVNYISALISCQEFQPGNPEYAMAISGKDDQLVQRVKRMVSNDSPSLNKIEKGVLAVGLVAAVTLSAAFSGPQRAAKEPKNNVALQDTLRVKKKQLNSTIQKNSLSKSEQHLGKTDKGLVPVENRPGLEQEMLEDREASLRDQQAALRDKEAILVDQQAALRDQQAILLSKQAALRDLQAQKKDRSAKSQDAWAAERDKLALERDKAASERDKAAAERDRLRVEEDLKSEGKVKNSSRQTTRTIVRESDDNPEKRKVTLKTGITADYLNKGEFDDNTSTYIANDLTKDGLIWKNEKLSFRIDKNKFEVNGKTLPESTHKKYAKKYLKRPDWILAYNYEIK
ncbi:Signal transducer regulating beta-lactamase production, contains metallopeptidase domain [Pedobacter steynii]|uniref:Signal transducer regulating beta-lactamase production, contains metallopeptidase domain n=1 Tax=Pedobacter steynii TaxID=430522 RepID=A0A1H0B5H7_9SPHI|nr:M56 family metallopeptidase [Pedobacter steynii]NQX41154.1 M48 family metalloprotease [Pedobacter steynii]SDN40832.1 Signal transducer regulating beta-lactamase production, contains metallopeptidase domain [Pedobacter steynii]